jgi:hypothetical protein
LRRRPQGKERGGLVVEASLVASLVAEPESGSRDA